MADWKGGMRWKRLRMTVLDISLGRYFTSIFLNLCWCKGVILAVMTKCTNTRHHLRNPSSSCKFEYICIIITVFVLSTVWFHLLLPTESLRYNNDMINGFMFAVMQSLLPLGDSVSLWKCNRRLDHGFLELSVMFY